MQPILQLLSPDLVGRILDEAFQLLQEPGIKVQSPEACRLLQAAGATVDSGRDVVRIPEAMVRRALESVPHEFWLYTRDGQPAVHYGGDAVHFDPGSSGVNVLDPVTLEHRPAITPDLIRLIQVAEMLPAYDAQSTAVVCGDVPQAIGDLYRLYLVLLFSNKPIVTGAFGVATTQPMFDLLAIFRDGREGLAHMPLAVFDVCPTPPLIWSHFAAQSLIDLARARVPAQMVSMPLAGVGAPVTLLGSVVQHAAESLSGIVIHQLAGSGSPIVWGGAPAIFDMRHGTTPMGAIETAMIDAAYAQVGRSLGLPTHAYLGATDAKLIDAQAGLESGISAVLGALAGINMISGAGMLDFLACQSAEKLVVDAEAIGMAKRLVAGVEERTTTLALEMFAGIDFKADFLKQKVTRQLFSLEQHLPSAVIDRGTARAWQEAGRLDTLARARARTAEILQGYRRPRAAPEIEAELRDLVARLAGQAGMDVLPSIGAEAQG
jgi:trimethylamine--corrinoid protein Co-methyltransferase